MAWWLVDSILKGTLDEDYPIMNKENGHSYYDKDGGLHLRQDDFKVEGGHDSSYYDWDRNGLTENPFDYDYGQAVDHLVDGMPSSFSTLSDNDDQIAHHIQANSPYNDGWTAEFHQKQLDKLNNEVQQSDNMSAHYFKYHEDEILKDIESYVSGTYRGHYTGTTHEYRNVQTLDLMASRDLASAFCQSNIIKYGSRYGSKDGKSKKDLLKVIHYAMLLLHFDEHYGKPSITSGNIDHTMP